MEQNFKKKAPKKKILLIIIIINSVNYAPITMTTIFKISPSYFTQIIQVRFAIHFSFLNSNFILLYHCSKKRKV